MLDLIVFILACYGMTNIICFSTIFQPIRNKIQMIGCPMCVGFHVGWFMFLLMPELPLFTCSLFIYACLSSGCSFILCNLFDGDGLRINKKSDN